MRSGSEISFIAARETVWGSAVRNQERDELGDLRGTIRTADRDAAERFHGALARPVLIDALRLAKAPAPASQ